MKSQIFRIIIIIILFIGALSAQKIWFSFFAKSRMYDARYNSERIKRGILPLPEDWITYDKTKNTKAWFSPNRDTSASVYRSMKMVVVKDGEVDHEYDHIVKRSEHGKNILVIYCYYNSVNSKVFIYNDSEKSKSDTITKPQADSILKSWNFKR